MGRAREVVTLNKKVKESETERTRSEEDSECTEKLEKRKIRSKFKDLSVSPEICQRRTSKSGLCSPLTIQALLAADT